MDPGLSALAGAVIGGLGTYLGTVHTQNRLDVRERAKQEEREAVEAREAASAQMVAARVLQEELSWAEARIKQALKSGRYWSAKYELKQEAWPKRRDQIAVALDDEERWANVRDGFRSIKTLELQASKRRPDDEFTRAKVSDWGMKQLGFGLKRVERAIETLQPVAKDRPRQALGRDPEQNEDEPAISSSEGP